MKLPLRPLLTLAATYVLVMSLQTSGGYFSTTAFFGAIAALVLACSACQIRHHFAVPMHRLSGPHGTRGVIFPVFCFCAMTILLVTPWLTNLMYDDGPKFGWSLRVYPMLALVGLLLCLRADWRQERTSWGYPLLFAAVMLLAFTCRLDVLTRSPNPVIDVFAWLRDSADHLLAGRNPYTHSIETPYGTARAAKFGVADPPDPRPPAYPPVPILLSAVPRLAHLDVRWANVVGELLGATALAGVGWRRNRPWLGLAVAVLFLNLPRSVWLFEQAWYEPMLVGLLGLGFWWIEYDGWRQRFGGVLLGLGLTAKQFGLPLLLPVVGPLRRQWRSLILGLGIAGLVMLPFVLAAPTDFFDIVVKRHFGRLPQYQSLTIASACYEWLDGFELPRWVGLGLAGALILLVSWRKCDQPAQAALPAGAALLAFCLCHTQGFPNYFYLCNYLLLLGFVAQLELIPKSDTGGPETKTLESLSK